MSEKFFSTKNFLATGGGGGRQKKLSPENIFLQSVPLTFWDGLTPLDLALDICCVGVVYSGE